MKKKILFVAAILTAGITFAQDGLMSKKGTPILPEAGDYGISFDASSILSFGGNLFNGDFDNSLDSVGQEIPLTIQGKYFVSATKAYRGIVRLGINNVTIRNVIADASPGADVDDTVEDEFKTSEFAVTVGGGIEMRRGKGRLQGVYGPIALISLETSKTEVEYGNDLEDIAPAGSFRTLEEKDGSFFTFEVGGFAGVEYFFAPKMSLGAEIGWTIGLGAQGNGETTVEIFDGTTTTEESSEIGNGGGSIFSVDTRPNAGITMNFYF